MRVWFVVARVAAALGVLIAGVWILWLLLGPPILMLLGMLAVSAITGCVVVLVLAGLTGMFIGLGRILEHLHVDPHLRIAHLDDRSADVFGLDDHADQIRRHLAGAQAAGAGGIASEGPARPRPPAAVSR
jgi:hypothetical protein